MNKPNEFEPVQLHLSESFFEILGNLSGNSCRVIFGVLDHLHGGNRIKATQKEIAQCLGIHRTAVCKAFSELRDHGLIFYVKKREYTVPSHYFFRG